MHHELTLHTNRDPLPAATAAAPATDGGYRGEYDYDYDPPVGSLPRLYRGVVWSDIVAEMDAELEARKAA
ncbi:MAG TPA: DUF6222 family protein [Pseudonocardiaceae bacterium]|nr:DUF6222 family protein [Pseudonocardiaceae bacterium]